MKVFDICKKKVKYLRRLKLCFNVLKLVKIVTKLNNSIPRHRYYKM